MMKFNINGKAVTLQQAPFSGLTLALMSRYVRLQRLSDKSGMAKMAAAKDPKIGMDLMFQTHLSEIQKESDRVKTEMQELGVELDRRFPNEGDTTSTPGMQSSKIITP